MKRREFIETTAAAMMGAILATYAPANGLPFVKKRIAMVGTGIRGTRFWGESLINNFGELIEFVGLCDINPGRVAYCKERMKVACPTFTDFEKMMSSTKPEIVIVATTDSEHDKQIIRALELGSDVITEKPMTTDEMKCKAILAAEKRTGRKVHVAFNYRFSPYLSKIKEVLASGRIGRVTSVDLNWYLNVYHGASYFRRWHGLKEKGGSLWVHKATHHFDLMNWWLDSDPVQVTAYGSLEHYGKNGKFRGASCRTCSHKKECKFYWDITADETLKRMYVDNEKHDGYIRDDCVFSPKIDIYDKMSAQVIYANGVTLNYSLTTYSPYEGHRLSFNGFNGRLDTWQDIPYQMGDFSKIDQAQRHALEMGQFKNEEAEGYEEIIVHENFKTEFESIKVPKYKGGHGGGDIRMHTKMFRGLPRVDPLKTNAGTRDGAMSILIGIAARKSIDEKRTVWIEELTDIKPMAKRPV